MEKMIHLVLFATIFAMTAVYTTSADAFPQVGPGHDYSFSGSDGGERLCRVNRSERHCTLVPRFVVTQPDPDQNRVRATIHELPVNPAAFGQPNYATASVYNDFELAGPPDNFVNVRVDIVYDYVGHIVFGAAHKGAVRLTLDIVNADNPSSPTPIASLDLFSHEDTGDQGFTDVAFGSEKEDLPGRFDSIEVMLRRGHVYRVMLSIEAVAVISAVGISDVHGDASWSRLSVHVDEDEAEKLDSLADQTELLEEIKALLLTPQGLRPGFPNRPGKPGKP